MFCFGFYFNWFECMVKIKIYIHGTVISFLMLLVSCVSAKINIYYLLKSQSNSFFFFFLIQNYPLIPMVPKSKYRKSISLNQIHLWIKLKYSFLGQIH
jgi:hypothetical protein